MMMTQRPAKIDEADFYDSTGEFFFSHGLVNRGSIEANGWYDGVKADAVLLDGATIHGGLFNSGTISATAYNEDARALIIGTGAELNDGLRSDNAVLLNEGTISAFVGTHTGQSDFDETETYQAIAITLQKWRDKFAVRRRFHQSQFYIGQCGAYQSGNKRCR